MAETHIVIYSWLSSASADKCSARVSSKAAVAAFHIHSNSLFMNYYTILSYVVSATNSAVKNPQINI
jgi:hypothetical protein